MANFLRFGERKNKFGVTQMMRCTDGEYVKFADIKELLQTDAQQPQLEMPCESNYILWCSMRDYNVAHAADIFRYIAQHIKRVR